MKYYAVLLAMISAVFIAGINLKPGFAAADQTQATTNFQKADLRNGAQLYDNWMNISNTKPEGIHPLYPADAKKSGRTTWRCKECHGWDYIGNIGRYSKGSHFTGISGVLHLQNENPESLYSSLTNKKTKHDFSDYLSPSAIWDLVKFLREGQTSIEPVINSQGLGRGNVAQGEISYNAHCSSCHGKDGNKIDFKSDKEGIQGVGWLANDNPQESIHKIRWGHPGSNMPSMIVDNNLTEQDAINILTYSQFLESK